MNPRILYLGIVVLLVSATTASAQTPLYLEVQGSQQGRIEGDVQFSPERDTIQVLSVDWKSSQGIDPRNGLPDGRRVSSVMVFTKPADAASVKLRRALGDVERMSQFEFRQYAPISAGTLEMRMRISLLDAYLVSLTTDVDDTGAVLERWAVSYASVDWENVFEAENYRDDVASSGNGID